MLRKLLLSLLFATATASAGVLDAPGFPLQSGRQVARLGGWTLISNRPMLPSGALAVTSQTTRVPQITPVDVQGVKAVFANVWKNGDGENPWSCAIYVEASLVGQGATLYAPNANYPNAANGDFEKPFNFGGLPGVWIRSGDYATSDPIMYGLPKGTPYNIQTYAHSSFNAVPSAPSLSGSTSGGSLAAGTYTGSITYVFPAGEETAGSATAAVTTTGGASSITVTAPSSEVGAIGWRAYFGFNGTASPQYARSPVMSFGTNFVYTTAILANQASVPTVIGGSTCNIPGGFGLLGGTAINYAVNDGSGFTNNYYGVNNASTISAQVSTQAYGPTAVLGLTNVQFPSIAIVGDSINQGTADTFASNSAGAFFGGPVARAILNQPTATHYNPSVQPLYGFFNPATGGERCLSFMGITGKVRQSIGGYASTWYDNYGTNDLAADTTGANLAGCILTIGTDAVTQSIVYIRETILPKTTSTDGWRSIANQTYYIDGTKNCVFTEIYRRQVNSWLLSTAVSPTVTAEPMAACYATGGPSTNLYAGGDGTARLFATQTPFVQGSEVVRVGGVVKTAGTDYTYDSTQKWAGVSYASGITFASAPASSAAVTANYTGMSGMRAMLGSFSNVVDTAGSIEVGPTGTPGLNGGFWAPDLSSPLVTSTITAISATALTDTSQTWGASAPGQYSCYTITITADSGTPSAVGQVRPISYNTANVATVLANFSPVPDVGATYIISKGPTMEGTHPTCFPVQTMAQVVGASMPAMVR